MLQIPILKYLSSIDHAIILLIKFFIHQDAGLERKDYLTYNDFKLMMKEYKGDFVAIGLDCKGAKQNFLDTSTNVARMTSFHIDQLPLEDSKSWTRKQWDAISTFLEENRQNIFYLFVFYVVTVALFIERFIREYLIGSKQERRKISKSHINLDIFKTSFIYLPIACKGFFYRRKISRRLLIHGGTYGFETYYGRRNRYNERISGRSIFLLQSLAADYVA